MKRISPLQMSGGFYPIAAMAQSCFLPAPHKGKEKNTGVSTALRPGRRHGQEQPAQDQERSTDRCGHRKQAVTRELPQTEIAGEQRGGDHEAEARGEAAFGGDEAAL